MHSPRPVSAESTLRGRTARALYHIPAGMCQKTPIRTDREGERTRIRTGGTINTSMPQHRNAKPAPSPAEQVRLPLQWCVYFRALRPIFHPLAEVRLLKPGIQRRWLAKDAPLPFRFASRFFNRFPVALPLRCFHLEEVSSRPPLSSNIFGRDPLSNVSYWNCGRPKLSKSP